MIRHGTHGVSVLSGGGGDATAELIANITADMDGDGDIADWDAWIVASGYYALGTGISQLTSIKGGINATQGTGSQQPSLDAGGGPGGRDRATFAAASSQNLQASGFTTASGDRWCLLTVGDYSAGEDATAYCMVAMNDVGGAVWQYNYRSVAHNFISSTHYGAGAFDDISLGAYDTDPHVFTNAFSNVHSGWLDNTETTSAQTAGASTRADSGDGIVTIGAALSGAGSPIVPHEGHVCFHMAARFTTNAIPAAIATVRGRLNTYYGGIY